MGDLTLHFSKSEFACLCLNCSLEVPVDKKLVTQLEQMRMFLETPIYINSGIRCPEYNKKISGSPASSHLNGTAADISFKINGARERYNGVEAAIHAGFNRIGVAETFLHLDCDPAKTPDLLWIYPPQKEKA